MLAQVAELQPLVLWGQVAGRLRHEHLPAVAGRADARRTVDVEADVAALGRRRLAGVDAHPDAERRRRRPVVSVECPLGLDRGAERVARACERDEELVAAAVDLVAAERLERLAHEPPVVGHHRRVLGADLLHESRRVLDVREEERDHPGGQVVHRASLVPRQAVRTGPSPAITRREEGALNGSAGAGTIARRVDQVAAPAAEFARRRRDLVVERSQRVRAGVRPGGGASVSAR